MAGHSKWANIKRKKEVKDAKKAKIFGKASREILVAIQQGDPHPQTNPRLRLAIQNAKAVSMPKENIWRLINKAKDKTTHYMKVAYEGYAPYGIGVLVETMTDNMNRTVAYLRNVFNKNGGSLDKKGAIRHLFSYKGVFIVPKNHLPHPEETALELIEAGMDDMLEVGDEFYITCLPHQFGGVQQAIEAKQIALLEAGLKYLPLVTTTLEQAAASRVQKLIDELENLDDVQHVYHNLV